MNLRLLAFAFVVVVVAVASCDGCDDAAAPSAANESAVAPPPPPPSAPEPAAKADRAEGLDGAAPSGGRAASAEAPSRAQAAKASGPVGNRAVRSFEKLFDGDSLLVQRNGVRRIDCERACGLEDACGFRDVAVCRAASCDDDVRRPSRMDYCLALDSSVTCLDAARCSCNESCWKRGECSGDHSHDDDCERSCVTLVQQEGIARYRENRCVLESGCGDLAVCSAL